MELTRFMFALSVVGAGIGVLAVLHSTWEFVQQRRAHRDFVRLLAERPEYRPMLNRLFVRAQQNGALQISEHEAIDLREQVRRAVVYLDPRERKWIEAGLLGRTVRGRQFYLYRVLCDSMHRLQHQG